MPRTIRARAAVRAAAFALGALGSLAPARAGVMPSAEVAAVRVASPPPQDASLADPVWATATKATAFENVTTETPAAEASATTALLLYDDENLYVGFIARQSAPVTTTQSVNDAGYGLDDAVTVAMDTSGGNAREYAFTATPAGVRYEYSSESSRYQPPWSVVAKIEPGGYRVMMTIPLADMRLARGAQRWRLDFSRRVAATGDLYSWAWDPATYGYCGNRTQISTTWCDSTGWPHVGGITVAAGGTPPAYADVYALGSAGGDRRVFETTPLDFTRQSPRTVGFDATVPITPTAAFVGAVGPDFSNVESDQTTIAPQEFALQFQEYRPFFAQGASFLAPLPQVGINGPSDKMFYTPSLGVIDDGFKIEGTAGRSALGVLQVKGDGFNDLALGYRYKRPDGSLSLELQGVDAEHPGVSDRTIGIGGSYNDLRSGLIPEVLYAQETGTLVGAPGLARTLLTGTTLTRGPVAAAGFYRDVGPEYSPVDGFTANTDLRGPEGYLQYNGVLASGPVKTFSATVSGDRFVDRSGAAHQADTYLGASLGTRGLVTASVGTSASELRTYAAPFPLYAGPHGSTFDQTAIQAGYRDGTPSPTDLSYAFGPFAVGCPGGPHDPLPCRSAVNGIAQAYVDQLDLSASRTLHGGLGVTAEYGGTVERAFAGSSDSQWLRKLALTRPVGTDAQLALVLREISGTGGFAAPGETLALSFHRRYPDQSQLFVEFGSPASFRTLDRFVVKYVRHVGKGGAGT